VGTYLYRRDILAMKDRGENSLTEGSKVRKIGVAGRLNGRESLGPTSTFIPCKSVKTDFMYKTYRVNGGTGDHEGYLQLARHKEGEDTAFLRHFYRVEWFFFGFGFEV
jgi:hypothetical protein